MESVTESSGDDAASAPTATNRHLTFLDLPRETQKEIFSHCSQGDLICLSLVSKHFRDLAASQLYRNFHIVFPDEDDKSFDSSIDGLAGGLDTFVTSEYDYAKHLRDLSLDTLSAGKKAENAYKAYLYDVSCGKFMNTLLLLTLRKAKSLETFRWNIRVELSRQVYRALHQIDTLSHVHIRLQAGPSLYETPPPLPYTSPITAPPTLSNHFTDVIAMPPPPPSLSFATPVAPSIFYAPPPTSTPAPPLPKPPSRMRSSRRTPLSKEPPTLSGFKKLKCLSVLDIDSLDSITEIKSCVRNSSGTLTKLKLSFSDSLGLQARKPPPDDDPDDSDPDDDFQVIPPLPGSNPYGDDVSGPAKAFRAQEEKKSQEQVLGRIFDVEPYFVKKSAKRAKESDADKVTTEEQTGTTGSDFINAIRAVSNKLMKDLNGSGNFSATQQEILDTIETAARKYVTSEEAKSKETPKSDSNGESSSSAEQSLTLEQKPDEKAPEATTSLFEPKVTKTKDDAKDTSPEDINIEEPEEQLVIDGQEGSSKDVPSEPASNQESSPENVASTAATVHAPLPNLNSLSNVGKAAASLIAQKENFKILSERLESFEAQANRMGQEIQRLRLDDGSVNIDLLAAAEQQMRTFSKSIEDIQKEMNSVEREIDDAEKQIPFLSTADDTEAQNRRISEYVRSTRGIALQSLSIYLIPVKYNVLSHALDLRALQRITLLNVGSQVPIWNLLAKENKAQPLALRKIFTDNVSTAFLNLVSQLEELHELFILERESKYTPESFAPRTTTTIDQIRRLVLKKHLPTLKRLMIKNQADETWDVDQKTMSLICKRGRVLEELAVSTGIRAIHTILQNISDLENLRALHIIQLRNDDTCVWVMRETRRFLVDNLSHYPKLKLEWVSINNGDRADRIVRYTDLPQSETKKSKKKGKEKAPMPSTSGPFPVLPLDTWDGASSSDEDDVDGPGSLKLDTIEDIHFYDVWGVRIFKKEIVSGRL